MQLHPTDEQLAEVVRHAEANPDQPVVMLNLLRFAERANPGHGCDGMTGEEAFQEYGRRLMAMDPPFAGVPMWVGNAGPMVVGPDDEHWDQAALIRYASAQAFLDAVTDEAYVQVSPARTAALADSRLVLMHELLHDTA